MIKLRDGASLDYNKPVKVYRNLNNGELSVMQGQKVIAYADYIYLKDVTFHVQKAGLAKVREEKRKNVHAYVKGYIDTDTYIDSNERVYYDPYKYDTFVTIDVLDEVYPIHKAEKVFINNKGEILANG